jgi:hypothetical protein
MVFSIALNVGLLWLVAFDGSLKKHPRTRRQTIDEQAQEKFFSSLSSDHDLYFQNNDDLEVMDTIQYSSQRVERQSDGAEEVSQDSGTRMTSEQAINILANQYDFANLATKREQQQIDERLRSLESRLLTKLDRLSTAFSRDTLDLTNKVRKTFDDVSKLNENMGHIKQNNKQTEDQIKQRIQSQLSSQEDNLKRYVHTELRPIIDSQRTVKDLLSTIRSVSTQSSSEVAQLADVSSNINNRLDDQRQLVNDRFRRLQY